MQRTDSYPTDEQSLLLHALVGKRHRRLYDTSAQFHTSVEMLARMLPLWVDALAADGERSEGDRHREIERLMMTRSRPWM